MKFCIKIIVFLAGMGFLGLGVAKAGDVTTARSPIPKDYVTRIEIHLDGKTLGFGPFVGYYLRPKTPGDNRRLNFICLNERQFYTRDLPADALLFTGDAVFVTLPDVGRSLPRGEGRIQPIFFADAPAEWLAARPAPQEEFVHFHSCYDDTSPVLQGYWLRHVAAADFLYDMGGRVGPKSPLYHEVRKGIDRDFARIVEFDRGPQKH